MTIAQNTNTGGKASVGNAISDACQRLATPLATGLFLISAVSGAALFFHWAPGAFHSMHEWLSMLLLAPVALHLWRNWRPFVGYARRGALYVPLALSLLVAAPFAVAGLSAGGGNPGFRTTALLTQTRLGDLAPVLKTTPDELLKSLGQRGVTARSADDTLDAIAAASGKRASELLVSVMPKR